MSLTILRPKPTLTWPITDKQVAFDYIWHHFVVEKNPPGYSATNGGCLCDTPTGGCAVGCLLPAETRTLIGHAQLGYNRVIEMRYRPLSSATKSCIARLIGKVFDPAVDNLLNQAQNLHDKHADVTWARFPEGLCELAQTFGLTLPTTLHPEAP